MTRALQWITVLPAIKHNPQSIHRCLGWYSRRDGQAELTCIVFIQEYSAVKSLVASLTEQVDRSEQSAAQQTAVLRQIHDELNNLIDTVQLFDDISGQQ